MININRAFVALVFAGAIGLGVAQADEEIRVVSWNVESGGAQGSKVAKRIKAMDGIDLWGLSEVEPEWKSIFETAAEDGESGDFKPFMTSISGTDQFLILFDKDQFEEVEHFEINWQDRYWFKSSMNPRPALVVRLRHKTTDLEFFFMVNHLYRGNGVDPRRLDQAKRLNEWAGGQALPVIAVGDYNFDWDLDLGQQQHNQQKGFGDLTACDRFSWLKPESLVKTQDSSFNSILDFIFLANATDKIQGESQIIVETGDFPDSTKTSDHRPVLGVLAFKGS